MEAHTNLRGPETEIYKQVKFTFEIILYSKLTDDNVLGTVTPKRHLAELLLVTYGCLNTL